ncbi:MAG: hypothetical protein IT548_08390 [Alphaproteobacteria bacterium]|nr:hypothetical protein [Alphaproteobacteria bacterium]
MFRVVKFAAIAAVALSLSACALTEDEITLAYAPPAGTVATTPGAEQVSVGVNATDERMQYQDRVSSKKNGYGMEMAAIRSTNSPIDLLKATLEQELSAHGFKVGAGGATVTAKVLRFYNDYKTGMFSGDAVADITVNLEVKDAAGKIVYSRALQSQGALKGIGIANGSNAKQALEMALTNAMAQLRNDTAFYGALAATGAKPAGGKPTS